LLEAYGAVLHFIYKQALQWGYDPQLIELPKEEIMQVLQHDLKESIDCESFFGYFYLWQHVVTKLPLPIPRLARIIPFIMSMWNAEKGVSDTISKFIWMNIHDPPCDTVQGHAISRMFLILAVMIHRLSHFFTSKEDLNEYPSLSHFRNAASHRSTFNETIKSIVLGVKNSFRPLAIPPPTVATRIEGARTRRGDTTTTKVEWGALPTWATPKKNLRRFYDKDPSELSTPSALAIHDRINHCTGNIVHRVNVQTKSPKGPGGRGTCVICGKLSNTWCMNCHRWLCQPSLAANRSTNARADDDAKFFKLEFESNEQGKSDIIQVCGIYSCWHKAHLNALEATGATERGWSCESECISP